MSYPSLPLALDLRLPAHRLAARPKGLDREPGPSRAHAPAARASSPLGDYARRDPDCYQVDEARKLSVLTFSAAGDGSTLRLGGKEVSMNASAGER